MIRVGIVCTETLTATAIFFLLHKFLWRRFGKTLHAAVLVMGICAIFVSISGESIFESPTRTISVEALDMKCDAAIKTQVYLVNFTLDGVTYDVPEPVDGQWIWYADRYCWFDKEDEHYQDGITQSVTFELPIARETAVNFLGNKWKGMVNVQVDGEAIPFDTYLNQDEGKITQAVLPRPSASLVGKAILIPALGFFITLTLLCAAISLLAIWGEKAVAAMIRGRTAPKPVQKLMQYRFLFEELVKRDFKKKYKRTVLGVAWSVLSPLLTLLVMSLVFTQFFGRHTPHYTTYLFCGNLVFSYFNESTSQGMTSLMGNAGIFTKVNVPKYLFLFSKNVQTLINFGLTLCVFFVFCVLDNITFTWKLVCLLYPIFMLVLFNIGVGLILSALFVFFRDIQYLWSVFTMLLMYMSAIFYTIDSYEPMARNLFLLNPVYLFIRYFRKIVIEATIPTVWFHLLMLADVVIVLAIGCWMYKKYNHKFLYYV